MHTCTLLAAVLAASTTACSAAGTTELRPHVPPGLELYVPMPEYNVLTRQRMELGRRLFFDATLSADGTVACASCHRPEHAFGDAVPISAGVHGRRGTRNAPPLLNVAWLRHLAWDGRSGTLEEQVLEAISDTLEMNSSLHQVVERLAAQRAYRRAFDVAYGEPVSASGVGRALAAFVRTLRSADTPYERFIAGDTAALDPLARRGFRVFVGRARCTTCHSGPLLSDGEFHNTGVAAFRGSDDDGRFRHTGDARDRGAFRTPPLREVARTAPYMHDGSFATLEDVIDFYDAGGHPNPHLDSLLRPLRLSVEEKLALATFLRALSSGR
jgi:cytochrome c peroxidase